MEHLDPLTTSKKIKNIYIYLGEERCDNRPSHFLLSLQLNLNQNWTATVKKHEKMHQHSPKTVLDRNDWNQAAVSLSSSCFFSSLQHYWCSNPNVAANGNAVDTFWCCPFLLLRMTAQCWGSGYRSAPRPPSGRLRAAAMQFCLHPPSPWCQRYSPLPDE